LNKLLNHPTPWNECNPKEKFDFKMMRSLLAYEAVDNEPSYLQRTCLAKYKTSFALLNSSVSYNAQNNATPLDTASIVKKVGEVLKQHEITKYEFAAKFLGIGHHISDILNEPQPWTECSEWKKGVYRYMHEWSMSKEQIAN
jgi:hypothetical protein